MAYNIHLTFQLDQQKFKDETSIIIILAEYTVYVLVAVCIFFALLRFYQSHFEKRFMLSRYDTQNLDKNKAEWDIDSLGVDVDIGGVLVAE